MAADSLFARAADRLYGLPPGEFIAAREDEARRLRADGEDSVAARVHTLRRPTASAWLANAMSRTHRDEIAALLDIGAQLRAAQRELAGSTLRELTAQRRRVVAGLVGQARKLARESGQSASDAVVRELESTFTAALADEQAGQQLMQGRLAGALQAPTDAGFGTVPVVPPRQREKPPQRASERIRKAEKVVHDAEVALTERQSEAESAREQADEAGERVRMLTEELAKARRSESSAQRRARTAAERVEKAEQDIAAARHRLQAAWAAGRSATTR